jgi:hypothetical protein
MPKLEEGAQDDAFALSGSLKNAALGTARGATLWYSGGWHGRHDFLQNIYKTFTKHLPRRSPCTRQWAQEQSSKIQTPKPNSNKRYLTAT